MTLNSKLYLAVKVLHICGFAILVVSCSQRKPLVMVDSFSRESYYSRTAEIPDGIYGFIDSSLIKQNREVICSIFKALEIDNMSVDVILTTKGMRLDTVELLGLLTFDREGNPLKIVDSTLLKAVVRSLPFHASYHKEDGDYAARIQLERVCSQATQ